MTRDATVTCFFILEENEARKRHPYAIVKSVRTTYSAEISNNTVTTNYKIIDSITVKLAPSQACIRRRVQRDMHSVL